MESGVSLVTSEAAWTNLAEAEPHSVRVVVLGNEDAAHKVSEFVSEAVYHQGRQTEGGHQGLQCMIRGESLHRGNAPSLPPPP